MMCWVGCSLTQLDTTNLTGLLQHLPMAFHVDNYHRTTSGFKSKTQMKLISTKLGNPEVCVSITVNIAGTLAAEAKQNCSFLAIVGLTRRVVAWVPCGDVCCAGWLEPACCKWGGWTNDLLRALLSKIILWFNNSAFYTLCIVIVLYLLFVFYY